MVISLYSSRKKYITYIIAHSDAGGMRVLCMLQKLMSSRHTNKA